jgi:hypothetical protein
MSDTTGTPEYVTYGGVQDRLEDVNHPDNLEAAPVSTDPSAPTQGTEDFITA